MRVLSIEIGQGLTRVVEMDYKAKKNPKVYQCFTFVTPKGIINDGMLEHADILLPLMKAACENAKVHTKNVVFSITSGRIASREVKLPIMKEKQIQEALNTNATDFFPVDMSQYHLSYKLLKKVNTAEEKSLYLNVLAVPNEITASYVAFAESWGMNIVAIDYVGNSIFQALESELDLKAHAIIKVEEMNTLITIVKDGKVSFQRNVNQGISGAIDAVCETDAWGEKVSYGEAIEILCGKTCIRRDFNSYEVKEEEDQTVSIMKARIRVTESLEPLVRNISRILEYYQESNDVPIFENIHLIGLGGDFSGLSRLLSNELLQRVRVFQGKENSSIAKNVRDDKFGVSSFVACVGAATNPLNLMTEQPKKKGLTLTSTKSVNPVRTGAFVCAGCLVIAAVLIVTSIMKYEELDEQVYDIKEHIIRMKAEGVEEIYTEYISLSQLSSELDRIYTSTQSRSEDLVAFIEELEEKMPSSIIVMSFSANSQGVNMSMTVDSKEAVAKTYMQLKTFESVEVISSSGLSESEDENGEKTVSFSVSLTYKPVGAEEAEAGTETDTKAESNADTEVNVETQTGTEVE